MAGRKRRKNLGLGEAIEDLTLHHYQQAWQHVLGGAPRAQICRLVGITQAQLHHMWQSGLVARGPHPAQPSFEVRLAEHLAAVHSAGTDAAMLVAAKGVRVLDKGLSNAERANDIAEMVLVYQEDAIRAEMAKPVEERAKLPEILIGEAGRRLLAVLHRYADIRSATSAFEKMFGMNLTELLAHKEALPERTIDAEAREKLPAAITLREEMGGSGKGAYFTEVAKTFDGWTEEELAAFVESGAEPARKG